LEKGGTEFAYSSNSLVVDHIN